jgi:hypothetical protein
MAYYESFAWVFTTRLESFSRRCCFSNKHAAASVDRYSRIAGSTLANFSLTLTTASSAILTSAGQNRVSNSYEDSSG